MTTATFGSCGNVTTPPAPVLGPAVVGSAPSYDVSIPITGCTAGATVKVTASNGAVQEVVCGASPAVVFSGLPNGTTTFTATQSNGAGTSPVSNSVSMTLNITTTQAVQCAAASGVTANSATINWTVSGAGQATQLQARWALDPNLGPWNVAYFGPFASGSAPITGLAPGTTYTVRYDTFDASGGLLEDVIQECTFATNAVGGAQTMACAPTTNIGPNSATLNWTVSGAGPIDYIHGQYAADPNLGPWVTSSDTGWANGSANIGGLQSGTTYTVRYFTFAGGVLQGNPALECTFTTP